MTSLGLVHAEPRAARASSGSRTTGIVVAGDVFALATAIGLAVAVRHAWDGSLDIDYWVRIAPIIPVFIVAFLFNGLYPGIALNPVEEMRRICLSATGAFLLLGAATFFSRDATSHSRAVFLLAWPLTMFLVSSFRRNLRRVCSTYPWWGYRAVVFGESDASRRLLKSLKRRPELGIRVVRTVTPGSSRFVDDSGADSQALSREEATYAIVATSRLDSEALPTLIERHAARFTHVLVVPDAACMSTLWVTAKDLNGVLGFEIRQSLASPVPQVVKRVLDIALIVIAAPVLLPVIGLLAALVYLASPGPVLYGQARVGKGGSAFTVWKFRTMIVGADAVLQRHLAAHPHLMEEWRRDHKLKRDPRVTAVGRLLRRTSLDELPQLWNVLVGEMSLVGPRPIVRAEEEKYGPAFRQYCAVRPGITGMWQISGRNNTTYDERVGLDEYYVNNWSVWLDLFILSQTARAVLYGTGAY
ncbi:MAG: undecaprenyl-phosphate galactose phosphotransferase WbaP [Gemmataceae bacterium]|nr:undecaprenyl-phosphate galactose phosphotransferase WbaP [Gemmataceae bacterium]